MRQGGIEGGREAGREGGGGGGGGKDKRDQTRATCVHRATVNALALSQHTPEYVDTSTQLMQR